jgi:hypothetical protein
MLYSGEKTSEIFFFDFGLCKLLTNLNVRHVCHSTMIEELNKTFQEYLTSFATQKMFTEFYKVSLYFIFAYLVSH